MKDPKGIMIKLNLNDPDKPVELVPVDEEGIRRYEEAMARLRSSMDYPPFRSKIDDDPELDALFVRLREMTKNRTFKLITPSAIKPGTPVQRDPGEVDYLITTYPITGPESVKIVKGRELGIGTGDKFVVADKMRSTLDVLGIDIEPKEVEVKLGNKRIAAMMEDPEFRKEWQEAVGHQLVQMVKHRLAKELVGENGCHPDKMLEGKITLPPGALEGINIYTQPSLRFSDAEVVAELSKESFGPKGEKILEELSEPELPQRQTGCRNKDIASLYYKDEEPVKEVMVPVGLLRELANIAIDNGYPCAEEAFQILTKNK